MKKSILIVSLIFNLLNGYSQEGYKVTFSGEGDTTGLTMVQVINLTQGDTVYLNGTDTLHLNPLLGIKSQGGINKSMRIVPNPMDDQTTMTFLEHEYGTVVISIFDLSGKTIYQNSKNVVPGTNMFRISGLSTGSYLIIVTGRTYNYYSRVISRSIQHGGVRVEQILSGSNSSGVPLKNDPGMTEMRFNPGDTVLFRGSVYDFKTTVVQVPSGSNSMIQLKFNFINCRDANGYNYEIVQIGNQTWMSENLKATKFRTGEVLHKALISYEWRMDTTSFIPGYCYYNFDEDFFKVPYGAIYNLYAAIDKICPTNFHIPYYAEWLVLSNSLGYPAVAGGSMKTRGTINAGTGLWHSPNSGATNSSGFGALPGGWINVYGQFSGIGYEGRWWMVPGEFYYVSLKSTGRDVQKGFDHYYDGYSIRCVRDY